MKTGAQLYTVRSYTQNAADFACSMKKIAEIGYKTVQISAVGRELKPEQIRLLKDQLRQSGKGWISIIFYDFSTDSLHVKSDRLALRH